MFSPRSIVSAMTVTDVAAFVSYPITFILREARAGRLRNSEAVLERLKASTDDNMGTALGPHDFVEIVRDNMDYIATHYPLGSKEFGWYSVFQQYDQMDQEHAKEIQLMEFDDRQETHRLVYAIGVNKRLKRITVIFRGTYAQETRDWVRNLQFGLVEVPLPSVVLDHSSSKADSTTSSATTTQLLVHQGIYEYLFHNSERGLDYPRERYEEIMGNILTCLNREEYRDFKVFVTGHSLGGALALLLSFFAAADARIPKPVTCVSLGSLLVGDAAFQQAFARLEQVGWIRHLRITNEHDPVPCLPPFTWYKPVGMHLRLLDQPSSSTTTTTTSQNDMPQGHYLQHASHVDHVRMPPINSFTSLWQSYQATGSLENFQAPHQVSEYLRRLEREKSFLQGQFLNECYRHPNHVGPDFVTRL